MVEGGAKCSNGAGMLERGPISEPNDLRTRSSLIFVHAMQRKVFDAVLSAALGWNVQVISSEWAGSYLSTKWDR